jgi:signal transduction histidine kinase
MINEASRQAHYLLDNLLNWSKIQTGKMTYSPYMIDLFHLADEVTQRFSGRAREKKIRIINQVKKNTMIYADKDMMTTVINNLVSNAVKYTGSAGKVMLSSQKMKELVDISVEDTGIGIPEHIMGKLFSIDRNYTANGTADETGTGIGLVLCKEFMAVNGGTINVRSKTGKGTAVIISIPVHAGPLSVLTEDN